MVGVVDSYRNPVFGVTVNFTATNATVNPASAQTIRPGAPSTPVTLGNTAGPASVTASAGALPVVVVQATVNTNPPLPNISAVVSEHVWVILQGTDLSETSWSWGNSDFVNGMLPVMLDDVSVAIHGHAAFVYCLDPPWPSQSRRLSAEYRRRCRQQWSRRAFISSVSRFRRFRMATMP
ncbi:MAG TPA: Ig-like domain-containing protein [Bryobacteraceae bacterium]|nr:Ig-like domain-containing protein [Bryobacteraceae bacterium]